LPLVVKKQDILFVHASPSSPEVWDYIIDLNDVTTAFRYFQQKICFFGHTHVPGIYSKQGKSKCYIQ
jgi:diadenosine tetraphosphatase ApaH/serine/threonine PP2A family protein phosphatase